MVEPAGISSPNSYSPPKRHPMPLSWNEIKHRAIAFSKAWSTETSEDAEVKSFWDAFFTVFGVQRRTVASFEEPVKKLSGQWGYIDLSTRQARAKPWTARDLSPPWLAGLVTQKSRGNGTVPAA